MSSKVKNWSTETQIPKTDCTIQIIDVEGKWAVVIRRILKDGGKKAIALKKIPKLTDTNIIGVIKDTIGREFALDTFTLGATMSKILREVYDKIKALEATKPVATKVETQKQVAQTKAAPISTPTAQIKPKSVVSEPASRIPDSFWSSYDQAPTKLVEPQITQGSQTQAQPMTPTTQATGYENVYSQQTTDTSSELDSILGEFGTVCPFCGSKIELTDEYCPNCKKQLPL